MCIAPLIDASLTYCINSQSGLSQGFLTYIPSSIADLAGLVVLRQGPGGYTSQYSGPAVPRPFIRAVTLPALPPGALGGSGSIGKAMSFTYNHVEASVARCVNEIQLYLAGNSIRKLPLELFTLYGLTVLSLRESSLDALVWRVRRFYCSGH